MKTTSLAISLTLFLAMSTQGEEIVHSGPIEKAKGSSKVSIEGLAEDLGKIQAISDLESRRLACLRAVNDITRFRHPDRSLWAIKFANEALKCSLGVEERLKVNLIKASAEESVYDNNLASEVTVKAVLSTYISIYAITSQYKTESKRLPIPGVAMRTSTSILPPEERRLSEEAHAKEVAERKRIIFQNLLVREHERAEGAIKRIRLKYSIMQEDFEKVAESILADGEKVKVLVGAVYSD